MGKNLKQDHHLSGRVGLALWAKTALTKRYDAFQNGLVTPEHTTRHRKERYQNSFKIKELISR